MIQINDRTICKTQTFADTMQLTTQTDYGLRVLMLLGMEPERLHTAAQIADRYAISRHHVAKIAKTLVAGGLVTGVRGRRGGLRLARPAQRIILGDAVRLLEGKIALVECFESGSTCRVTSACTLRKMLREALAAFNAVLANYTLADAIASPASNVRMLQLLRDIPIVATRAGAPPE